MSLPKELNEIKELKQWVGFRFTKVKTETSKKEKQGKMPINPMTGKGAKANDPSTWGTYDEAVKSVERFHLDGIGFEFASGYFGIDLDDVIDEKGNITSVGSDIVDVVDSYTEFSPSGRGLHILCKTSLDSIGVRNDNIGLEMYNTGRFFTITGNPYGKVKPIQERTEQVKAVYEKYWGSTKKITFSTVGTYAKNETDTELWDRMFNSRHGYEIALLYQGDTSRYGDDHSRADQALVNHLGYWTGYDREKMDRMFRQSGLIRPKWDEMRGQQTYGQMTIDKALRTSISYAIGGGEEKGSIFPLLFVGSGGDGQAEGIQGYLSGRFDLELESFRQFSGRKTGYGNIDKIVSLYPGLYVLGAVSSLGKTTFACQLSDQLARSGDHVLYFSLEQSRLELVTKGLSRLTAQENLKTAVSAIEIRDGKRTDVVERAIEAYKEFSKHELVIECGLDTTAEMIVDAVKDYIRHTGKKPVVFVDYLQIVRPSDSRQTMKDAVDGHVRAFKKLQVENDLVVVLISSLNRQNYLLPVDFESFKESGGIEYTADVMWGLQLQVMNDKAFETTGSLRAKREIIRNAKREHPRKVELVCLKNRYGVSSYSCRFLYYAKYDWFVPVDSGNDEFVEAVKGQNDEKAGTGRERHL